MCVCVCVALVIQHTNSMRHIKFSSVICLDSPSLPHYLVKGTISEKKSY